MVDKVVDTAGSVFDHAIAPRAVLRGAGAWRQALPTISALCRRPLLLGRSSATA